MGEEGPSMVARLVSEAVGTYFLVLTVFGNVVGGTSATFVALSIASVLMIMIYALGEVSGAHFNPAVSVAISVAKQQDWKMTAHYIGAQVAGAGVAAMTSLFIFGGHTIKFSGVTESAHSPASIVLAEILFTCMLCFVVLNVACSRSTANNQFYGLAIGYVITAAGCAIGPVSGGHLNPAVTAGIAFASASMPALHGFLAYAGAQIIGAALAAFLFKYMKPEDNGGSPSGEKEKLFAELTGTFFLLLTAGCSILNGTLTAALAIGSALMCMIYSLGSLSGANFNPAVTIAAVASGQPISYNLAVKYMGAQTAGAVLGALVYSFIYKTSFGLAPAAGSWMAVGLAEVLYTFLLCFVVLAVAYSKSPSKDFFGLAIGSCVTVGGFAAAATGGGVLNPAAAIGISVADKLWGGDKLLNGVGYGMLECVGAVAAAGVFSQTHGLASKAQ